MDLKKIIRNIPDFPIKGVMFRDITTLLKDPEGLKYCIDSFVEHFKSSQLTQVVAIESRGFIFGGAVAEKLGIGFVPIRKKGKLPFETISETYELEYGTDTIEIHKDALDSNDKVLILDDLLATGGTAKAAINLVNKTGAVIGGIGFVIGLSSLDGQRKLGEYDICTLVTYDSE